MTASSQSILTKMTMTTLTTKISPVKMYINA